MLAVTESKPVSFINCENLLDVMKKKRVWNSKLYFTYLQKNIHSLKYYCYEPYLLLLKTLLGNYWLLRKKGSLAAEFDRQGEEIKVFKMSQARSGFAEVSILYTNPLH